MLTPIYTRWECRALDNNTDTLIHTCSHPSTQGGSAGHFTITLITHAYTHMHTHVHWTGGSTGHFIITLTL